ncbi:MAG: hypothetical protein EXR98_20340 [Gemmataceae bacterium]|nr:hypothetical protein [Gemmataceae bacterium]
MRMIAVLLALSFLVGCKRESVGPGPIVAHDKDDKTPVEKPDDKKKDPPAPEKPTDWAKEIETLKPVEPVDCEKLLPLLPKAPAGYQTQDAFADSAEFVAMPYETNMTYTIKYGFAEGIYRNGDKSLTVKILDTARIDAFYKWIPESAGLKSETEQGYKKFLTIDGNPSLEKYSTEDKRGDLTVMVAKRFQIEIIAKGVPPEFVQSVLKGIDRKALATLK